MARPELLAAIGAAQDAVRQWSRNARRAKRDLGYVPSGTRLQLKDAKETLAEALAKAEAEDAGKKTWAAPPRVPGGMYKR